MPVIASETDITDKNGHWGSYILYNLGLCFADNGEYSKAAKYYFMAVVPWHALKYVDRSSYGTKYSVLIILNRSRYLQYWDYYVTGYWCFCYGAAGCTATELVRGTYCSIAHGDPARDCALDPEDWRWHFDAFKAEDQNYELCSAWNNLGVLFHAPCMQVVRWKNGCQKSHALVGCFFRPWNAKLKARAS